MGQKYTSMISSESTDFLETAFSELELAEVKQLCTSAAFQKFCKAQGDAYRQEAYNSLLSDEHKTARRASDIANLWYTLAAELQLLPSIINMEK